MQHYLAIRLLPWEVWKGFRLELVSFPGRPARGRDGVRLARGVWGRPKYFAVFPECSEPLLGMWPPFCGLFRPCPYGSQVQRREEEMEEDQHSFENES